MNVPRRAALCLLSTALALALLATAATASAQTITVTSSVDSTSGCTLRNAITAANTNAETGTCPAGSASGSDTIDFQLPSPSTITLGSALPSINTNVEVAGPGAEALTISGAGAFRVFLLEGGTPTISISGLTITGGHCGEGCGINHNNEGPLEIEDVVLFGNIAEVNGGVNAFPGGGAINNAGGTLKLVRSVVRENSAIAKGASNQAVPTGGGITNNSTASLTLDRTTVSGNNSIAIAAAAGNSNAIGGGVSNRGTLTILRSTISGNEASSSGSTVSNASQGAGVANANSNQVVVLVERSTIASNIAKTVPGGDTRGGGIQVGGNSVSSFEVLSSTIAANSAFGGANVEGEMLAEFRNTIVAEPIAGENCSGGVTSLGFNLDDDGSCGFNQASDLEDDPGFDPVGLADNGGPTETLALATGSAAIDQGIASAGEVEDQRGLTRPVLIPGVPTAVGGDGTDIGAFEVQLPAPPNPPSGGGGGGSGGGSMQPPAAAPTPTPKVSISAPKKTTKRLLTIRFSADVPGATFTCKLDAKKVRACSSPFKTPKLALGKHTLTVVASAAGKSGTATKPFRVVAKRQPRSG